MNLSISKYAFARRRSWGAQWVTLLFLIDSTLACTARLEVNTTTQSDTTAAPLPAKLSPPTGRGSFVPLPGSRWQHERTYLQTGGTLQRAISVSGLPEDSKLSLINQSTQTVLLDRQNVHAIRNLNRQESPQESGFWLSQEGTLYLTLFLSDPGVLNKMVYGRNNLKIVSHESQEVTLDVFEGFLKDFSWVSASALYTVAESGTENQESTKANLEVSQGWLAEGLVFGEFVEISAGKFVLLHK